MIGVGRSAKDAIDQTRKAAADAGITGESIRDAAKKTKDTAADIARFGKRAADSAIEAYTKSRGFAIEKLDYNGDGKVDIEDIIILSLKTPGVQIDRTKFLQKELFKNHPQEMIDQAIAGTPAKAGIPREEIDKIADEVINYERNCVSGISTVLGMPGGLAMAATIPADIIQYFGYTLRAAQKLLYLYGFPQIEIRDDGLNLDSETINQLTLCLGIMYGAAGAANAMKGIAKALASGVEKQILRKALTRGGLYPIVRNVAKWFGLKLTRKAFAGFFKNSIPVVGGIIGGGITFASFKPCCSRLKSVLMDTMLSNPDHISDTEEEAIAESILTESEEDREHSGTQE